MDRTERRAYVVKAAARSKALRVERTAWIEANEANFDTARGVLRRVRTDNRRIHFRNSFMSLRPQSHPTLPPQSHPALPLEGIASAKPPMASLLFRHPLALRTYIALVFAAHYMRGPGRPAADIVNELRLFGCSTSTRLSLQEMLGASQVPINRFGHQMRRSLTVLADKGLIELPASGQQGRFTQFSLLCDSSSGHAYRVPGNRRSDPVGMRAPEDTTAVASGFFSNLWYLALNPREIATYLMLLNARVRFRGGKANTDIWIPRTVRLRDYGLSDETYVAHRELSEFGLLWRDDPVPGRRRGRIRPGTSLLLPFEFHVNASMVDKLDAPTTIYSCLTGGESGVQPAPHLQLFDFSNRSEEITDET